MTTTVLGLMHQHIRLGFRMSRKVAPTSYHREKELERERERAADVNDVIWLVSNSGDCEMSAQLEDN